MRALAPHDGRAGERRRAGDAHGLTQALIQGATRDPHTAALIALLHAMHVEHRVVAPHEHGMSGRQLRARAGAIAEGDWASDAVRKAISETLAAKVAVTAAGAAAGTAGS